MISICLTTRERPAVFMDMCTSALDTAYDSDSIEFISYHDHDDASLYTYLGRHREVYGETQTISEMMNACYSKAKGDILMYIADDFIFESADWDVRVREEFEKCEDKILLVCPINADFAHWNYSVIGFVHRRWVEALGYLIPTHLGECPDRWLDEVAVALGRRVFMQDVLISHTNVRDKIHANKNRSARRNKWTRKYMFPEMVELRKQDVEKLRREIDGYINT